ncbi:MAG TPA: hypothetical protein VGY32_04920 [Solirubrobacteraceae bacterium]|jgi:hypothetical protein|nr:hypothetical protein [Solirubrobacteraceae bacterium]
MSVLAPDLALEVIVHYKGSPTVEQTYAYTLAADTTADFTISVGFQDGSLVVYHYDRTN